LSDAQIDAIFDLARMRESKGNDDLVAIGATAIGALIAGLHRDALKIPRSHARDASGDHGRFPPWRRDPARRDACAVM
jgi:hypothetical protein